MKKHVLIALAAATALALPITACDSGTNTTTDDSTGTTQSESGDFDAVDAYWGQWRGSVKTEGTSVYGTTSGSEPMLDVNLEQDGTCTVEPLASHADLPSDSGTWEGTETEITLHLESQGDIVLSVATSTTLEGDAHAFGIADFDTINFDFYG